MCKKRSFFDHFRQLRLCCQAVQRGSKLRKNQKNLKNVKNNPGTTFELNMTPNGLQ